MRQLERLNGPKEIMQLCLETGAATFAGTIDYEFGYQPEVGTLKMRMGATHFLMKRLPKVAAEMALHVLAYNLTRVMNIMGHPAADGRDPSIVKAGKSSSPSATPPHPGLCGKAF